MEKIEALLKGMAIGLGHDKQDAAWAARWIVEHPHKAGPDLVEMADMYLYWASNGSSDTYFNGGKL